MRRIILLLLVGLFAILANDSFSQKGYEIKIKVKGTNPGDTIVLGHHFNSSLHPDDSAVVSRNGWAVFSDDDELIGGMYLIFLPTKTYFDILIGDNQHFAIENDTADFLGKMKVEGSKENSAFREYQLFMYDINKKSMALRKKLKTAQGAEKTKIEKELKEIGEEVKAHREKTITENPDLFFSKFLNATKEVEVPDNIPDNQKYDYYRKHYFDNFDVSDGRLLRTPIYEGKIKPYFTKIVPQIPDTVIKEVDWLLDQASSSQELFRYMLVTIHNHYATTKIMGLEKVFVHIAEKYYIPHATWSDQEYIDKLKERVRRLKPNLVNYAAQDLRLVSLPKDKESVENMKAELQTLKELGTAIKNDESKNKEEKITAYVNMFESNYRPYFEGYSSVIQQPDRYFVLWFWEPDCSHCRAQTPELIKVWEKYHDKGFNVYAVWLKSMVEDWDKFIKTVDEWMEFVIKHDLEGWHNVWDPYYQTNFRDLYDISSSPVSYFTVTTDTLNPSFAPGLPATNKMIIAKRISPDQIEEITVELMMEDALEAVEKLDEKQKIKKMIEFFDTFVDKTGFTHLKKSSERYLDGKLKEEALKHLSKRIEDYNKIEAEMKAMKDAKLTADAKVNKIKQLAKTYSDNPYLRYFRFIAKYTFDKEKESEKIKQVENYMTGLLKN